MYKVFFNKKPIFLINKLVMPKKDMPIIFIKFVSKDKIIKAIKSKKVKALYIYHSNLCRLQLLRISLVDSK